MLESRMTWVIVLQLVTGDIVWRPMTQAECAHVTGSMAAGATVEVVPPKGEPIRVAAALCMLQDEMEALQGEIGS